MNKFIVIEQYNNSVKRQDVAPTLRMLYKSNIFYQVSALIKEKKNIKPCFTIRITDTFIRNNLLLIGTKFSIFIYISFFKPLLSLEICHLGEKTHFFL